jgi:hypothetical protein
MGSNSLAIAFAESRAEAKVSQTTRFACFSQGSSLRFQPVADKIIHAEFEKRMDQTRLK